MLKLSFLFKIFVILCPVLAVSLSAYAVKYKINIENHSAAASLHFQTQGDFWFHHGIFDNKFLAPGERATFDGEDKGFKVGLITRTDPSNTLHVAVSAQS